MLSKSLEISINKAIGIATKHKHKEVTIEHLLAALIEDNETRKALIACSANLDKLKEQITSYLDNLESTSDKSKTEVVPNATFQKIIQRSAIQANISSVGKEISCVNVLAEILLEFCIPNVTPFEFEKTIVPEFAL